MAGIQNLLLRKNPHATTAEQLAPGEYVHYPRGVGYGEVAWFGWCCPGCQQPLMLLRSAHTVDYEGQVAPSVRCPGADCRQVSRIVVSDWVPDPMGYA